jgi:hypothetical protein
MYSETKINARESKKIIIATKLIQYNNSTTNKRLMFVKFSFFKIEFQTIGK